MVYLLGPDHYLGNFDGKYIQWPATMNGWRKRRSGSEHDVDTSRELPTVLASLALRLSGVEA